MKTLVWGSGMAQRTSASAGRGGEGESGEVVDMMSDVMSESDRVRIEDL